MAETDQTTPNVAEAGSVVAPSGAPGQSSPQPPSIEPLQQPAEPIQQSEDSLGYNPQEDEAPEAYDPNDVETITWTASEYIAHHKTAGWYGLLALGAIAAAALIYVLTRDIISASVVIVGAIALAGYGSRQPRQLQYRLDSTGLTIGEKYFNYESFRYFSVMQEGAFSSIIFMPLKRFAPLTTIYYAPEDEDRIINLLAQIMPHEEHKLDPIDTFMQRIRF